MAKPPKIPHVKLVRAKGKTYPYFNTGQKKDGKTIYAKLPALSSPDFWASYSAFKAARTKRQTNEYTIAHLIRDYQLSAEWNEHSEGTRVVYDKTMRKIERTLGEFPVNDVESDDVETILEGEMAEKPGAHNLFIAVLSGLYRWARKKRRTEANPTAEISKRKTVPHEPWPTDILEAALRSESDRIRLAVHLLYFTGQRIGDVCALRWGDVRGGTISLKQQKGGRLIDVHMTAELASELECTPKRGLTILADEDGTPVKRDALRTELQAFTAALGVKTVPHGLRKNAVNALLEAGCTVPEVAAITGQTYKIVEHYAARVNTRSMGKAAILKLDAARRNTK